MKASRTVPHLYVAVEVGWCCCGVPDLERQHGRKKQAAKTVMSQTSAALTFKS